MSSERSSLRCRVGGLDLRSPIIAASGTWPHDPSFWRGELTAGLGAICTKGITRNRREGNRGIRLWETPCGLLNSIGLQNSGVEAFISGELPEIGSRDVSLIANVAVEDLPSLAEVLKLLASVKDQIDAVELNISCPNVDEGGIAWGSNPESTAKAVACARSLWGGPLWVKLTPHACDIVKVATSAQECGADALVVANTWLGMAIDVESEKPVFDRVVAGLSGPAVFPLALRLVWEVARCVSIPVIGCGGIAEARDVVAMLFAGASAVEMGTALFLDLNLPAKFTLILKEYMQRHGYALTEEMVGVASHAGGI
jgi:dihydroorotate dehydrogenase (NAD+) catalytic subunit